MGYAIRARSRAWEVREGGGVPYGAEWLDEGHAGPAAASSEVVGPRKPDAADPESVDAESTDPDVLDDLDDLGDEIATLAAHIHAARARFLALIARFDRLKGWEPAGHRNCACWLSERTGYDLGTAGEYVRVARALERLPRIGAAMARGALSFSQVRALTRVAEPETEAELLPLAEGCTVQQLERMVRAWRKVRGREEAERERERHASRTLSVFPRR